MEVAWGILRTYITEERRDQIAVSEAKFFSFKTAEEQVAILEQSHELSKDNKHNWGYKFVVVSVKVFYTPDNYIVLETFAPNVRSVFFKDSVTETDNPEFTQMST